MIFSNLHTHTTFSDGKNSPDEMIKRAVERSFTSLGFSDHSERMVPSLLGSSRDNLSDYRESILDLKERYAEDVAVFCGVGGNLPLIKHGACFIKVCQFDGCTA